MEYAGYLTRAIRLRDKLAALWQKLQFAPAESRRDRIRRDAKRCAEHKARYDDAF